MKKDSNYLSEYELERLILHIEQNELVAAPPELAERILEAVAEDPIAKKPVEEERKEGLSPGMPASARRKREFRRYCFRVLGGVAAAIAVIFLLPYSDMGYLVNERGDWEEYAGQETVMRQEALTRQEAPTRQELLQTSRYATKEEALQDTGLLVQWLGGSHIFDRDDRWNIFVKRDGG